MDELTSADVLFLIQAVESLLAESADMVAAPSSPLSE